MSSESRSRLAQRPCIIALRENDDYCCAFWDYLNVLFSHNPVCFSVFEDDFVNHGAIHVRSENRAYLTYGYTSDTDGKLERHNFSNEPREITYVINFTNIQSLDAWSGESLACPKSGSVKQNQLIDDKSIQRMIVSRQVLLRLFVSKQTHADRGMMYTTLTSFSDYCDMDKVEVVDFSIIPTLLQQFVKRYFAASPHIDKVVIKNTNWQLYYCAGILIVSRDETEQLPKLLEKLNISADHNVQVEEFVSSRLDADRPYHRIRVYSSLWGAHNSTCENGRLSEPQSDVCQPTSLSPLYYTFSETPYCHGDSSSVQVDAITNEELRANLHRITQHYWDTMLPHLTTVDPQYDTLLFGFDFLLSPAGPVCIEVNNLDSLAMFSVHAFETHPSHECIDVLRGVYNHILNRSNDFILVGRVIIVVGAASSSVVNALEHLTRAGVSLVLVDPQHPSNKVTDLVNHYIRVHLRETAGYENEARRVVNQLKQWKLDPFSVVSLQEDLIPFRAYIQDALDKDAHMSYHKNQLHDTSLLQTVRYNDKVEVNRAINEISSWHFNPDTFSVAPSIIVLDDDNVHMTSVTKPHLVTLSTPSIGFNDIPATCTADIAGAFAIAKRWMDTSSDFADNPCFPCCVFLREVYEGSEHAVDIIMENGNVLFHVFSDKSPNIKTDDMASSRKYNVLPSNQITKSRGGRVLNIITRCLRRLNMCHGVFSVEFTLTPFALKIIDVHQFPGGFDNNQAISALYNVSLLAAQVFLQSNADLCILPLEQGAYSPRR